MNYVIIPSIIASSQVELDTRLKKILPLRPKLVQIDVMDGQFVPHTSLEFNLKLPRNRKIEAHLMMNNPKTWFLKHKKQVDSVIVPYESKIHIHDFIAQAKKNRKKIGIAINPETNAEDIIQYLKHINKVLVMTVHPGSYGSPFLPITLDKIKHLRGLAPKMDIEVDGGINPETLAKCKTAGANQFVVGSHLQNAKDVIPVWKELESKIK